MTGERLGVADMLRHARPTTIHGLMGCLGMEAWETVRDMPGRIADLIDPTCHAEPVVGMPGRHRCSACHVVWQPIEDQHGRFCSHCGARRTRDATSATGEDE